MVNKGRLVSKSTNPLSNLKGLVFEEEASKFLPFKICMIFATSSGNVCVWMASIAAAKFLSQRALPTFQIFSRSGKDSLTL